MQYAPELGIRSFTMSPMQHQYIAIHILPSGPRSLSNNVDQSHLHAILLVYLATSHPAYLLIRYITTGKRGCISHSLRGKASHHAITPCNKCRKSWPKNNQSLLATVTPVSLLASHPFFN